MSISEELIMFDLENEKNNYLVVCEKSKGLSELTLKAYKIDLRQFCDYMGDYDALSKNDLILYINYLHQCYKPKSAKRKIACIKAFYRYMEIEEIIEQNPFHKILVKYKEHIILPRTIPLNCIYDMLYYSYSLIENAKTTNLKETAMRNAVVLELLFSTGMRVSEISNLKIVDVNWNNGIIRIFGKGSKERVMCVSNEEIVKLICEYLKARKHNSEYILTNRLGNRLSEQSIRNMVNEYAKAVNAPLHITPHMFRHTFATALHDEDVDIQYIQQFLGHSSITTTQIYSHISTNKIKNILENKHPRNTFNFSKFTDE